jgi:hypothetical protein
MVFPLDRARLLSAALIPMGLFLACTDGANSTVSNSGGGGMANGGQSDSTAAAGGNRNTGGATGNTTGGAAGTTAQGGNAGTGSGGTAGTAMNTGGTPSAQLVPMFIAVGRGGRRVLSCDDGHTWQTQCETDGVASPGCLVVNDEGDHAPWASTGFVTDGQGTFMALFGWFGNLPSAQVLRTRDGVRWTNVLGGPGKPQGTYGTDIAYGNKVFAINAQRSGTHRTLDGGNTWTTKEFSQADLPHRRSMVFVPYQTGRFVSYGDNGRLTHSNDNGATWIETTNNSCPYLGSFVWGNGVLLSATNGGTCRSLDGGLTWASRVSPAVRSNPLWTGKEFFIWENGKIATSPDGVTWASVASVGNFDRSPGVNGGGWPALIARSDSGKFVGIDELGDAFHWSDDGLRWTRMNGPMGTTLTDLLFGYGESSARCPIR